MDLKIYSLEINTSHLPKTQTVREFTVLGDPGAVFSFEITNEDRPLKYYNFNTKTFSTTKSRLDNISIPSSGVYIGSITFPTVSDDDYYDLNLWASGHYNTRILNSKSLLLTTKIYQYIDKRITLAVASKSVSGQYTGMPTSVTIDGPQYTDSEQYLTATIDWTLTAQPAVADTYALSVVRQPLETDFEVMETVTVDGAISSSTAVVVDDLENLAVGMTLDKIHSTYETSSIATITALDATTKTITLDTAKSAGDGQNLIFIDKGFSGIDNFTSANVKFTSMSAETTDFTSTVNNAAEPTSTSITMDSVVGIRGGGEADNVKIEGIGFDNSTTQYVETVNHSTNVITVTSAQTLKDNTILTFRNCANTATIKTKVVVKKMPSRNITITLDLDNIILSSTS